MNYSDLFDTIKSYVENDFPSISFTNTSGVASGTTVTSVEQVNTFIQQAEQRIYNVAQPPALRKNVNGSFTANNKYLNLPSNFLSVFSLAVYTTPSLGNDSPQAFLLNKDVNFLRESYPSPTDTGVPQYYALFGSNTGFNVPTSPKSFTLMVAPTPDQSYVVELHYFYYPESIVTAGTSWLGDNFDSVLLYGSLLEAYTYMKGEPQLLAEYKSRYDEALALYKQLSDGKERQDAYRSGQVRVPVN
jgi:hypothetical protein